MADESTQGESHLESAYRSAEAADEYFVRHQKSHTRRWVSRRETRLVLDLLHAGFGALHDSGRKAPHLGRPVLDAPCGTGRLTAHLRSAGYDPIACDSSVDMIRRGTDGDAIGPGRSIGGSLFALPFGDGVFAGAVCVRFMHHLESGAERRAVLGELRRVVAGPVVASVWTGVSVPRLRRSIKSALGRRGSSRFCVPLATLRQDARSAGWQIEKVRYLFAFMAETAYLLLI